MNLGYLLTNTAARLPHHTAVIAEEGRFTYAQLEERSRRLAGALLAAGLEPGQRVALLFYNSARMVEAYFAVVRAGLVATPVNFRLVGREMLYILNHSGSAALLYGAEFEETVAEIQDRLETVRLLATPGGGRHTGARDYEDLLASGPGEATLPPRDESHPCQIMYTSGTTGRPKGAVISHGNVLWNLVNTIYGREDRAGQRSIIVGPLYHTAALNNHLTIQVALGGTCILVKKFEPELLLQTIQRHQATTISGSPAMYNLLMQHPRAHTYDTRSITKCTSGADKLAMDTKRRLMRFFPNINGVYDVYGCTEASPCITILGAADSLRKDGSVGLALPFLQARVVDDQGRPLPPGEVGELVCRGPNVMQGYHQDPQATRQAIRQGWLYTGDLARVDEEGFFYIVDRKKDMILSGGENIYPREVEEVLYSHPEIVEAAVVGLPDPTWGERVAAFVVTKPHSRLTAEDIVAFCKKHLAGYKKPRQVVFLPELPRNASGKVLKRELRQRWGQTNHATPPGSPGENKP